MVQTVCPFPAPPFACFTFHGMVPCPASSGYHRPRSGVVNCLLAGGCFANRRLTGRRHTRNHPLAFHSQRCSSCSRTCRKPPSARTFHRLPICVAISCRSCHCSFPLAKEVFSGLHAPGSLTVAGGYTSAALPNVPDTARHIGRVNPRCGKAIPHHLSRRTHACTARLPHEMGRSGIV